MATKDSCRETRRVLRFLILWVLGFFPLTMAIGSNVSDHDLEIRNYLKKLNKPYVKSIKSPDGDIIDCVPIHLQPAFDNLLLKNHTIQMQPSSYPKGFSDKFSSNEKPFTQPWQTNGKCPKGTIPIRRTSEEDLRRANSLQSFGKKTPRSGQTNDEKKHEHAVQHVGEGNFYGAKAGIGVWNPRVQEANEFSLAQMWVSAGDDAVDLNTVEAGWQVYPNLYGDSRTRIFAYWTRDAYRSTGCYNLRCPGFVQTDGTVALGSAVSHVSSYRGDQYAANILIFKDPQYGSWWLNLHGQSIGYWPASLFTHLRDSATSVEWGGEVVNRAVGGRHTTTEMGSGHFSGEGYQKAANFINLQVVDASNVLRNPVGMRNGATNSDCYDLIAMNAAEPWGEFFYFGGPGRNPRCA